MDNTFHAGSNGKDLGQLNVLVETYEQSQGKFMAELVCFHFDAARRATTAASSSSTSRDSQGGISLIPPWGQQTNGHVVEVNRSDLIKMPRKYQRNSSNKSIILNIIFLVVFQSKTFYTVVLIVSTKLRKIGFPFAPLLPPHP